MRPYLNLDFQMCYLGHATGFFIGDFCLVGSTTFAAGWAGASV